jgi:hypothetical protein
MTTPPAPELSEEERRASIAYTMESMRAMARWQTRGKFISFAVAAAAFVLTLLVMAKVTPSHGGVGFFAAIGAALVAQIVTLALVLPQLPTPVLRCPWCGGRVPLIQRPKPFHPYDHTKVCPSCQRAVPSI